MSGVSRVRLAMAGLALALLVGAMAWQTAAWTEPETTLAAMLPYAIACALLWAVLTHLPPVAGGGWTAGLIVIVVAAAARLAVVLLTGPVLSDDLWRYLHDGHTVGALGVNPYALPPSEHNPLGLPINHPHLVTIYQPTSQWVFAGLARLGANDVVFRLGFAAVDVALVALLVTVLIRDGRTPWLAALYGWHPLAISETAGSGHQDVLGIVLLVAAVVAIGRGGLLRDANDSASPASPPRERGVSLAYVCLAALLLAAAIAVKPIVAPLALPMAWSLRGKPVHLLAALVTGGAATAALYVPFALMPGGLRGLFDTGRTFVDTWAANGSVHPLLTHLLGDRTIASVICAAALLVLLVVWTVRGVPVVRIAMLYLLSALLLSSTVHPWYVLWPLAFVPLALGRGALVTWVLSGVIVLAYTAHLRPEGQAPTWAVAAQYVPVYLAVVLATLWPRRAAVG